MASMSPSWNGLSTSRSVVSKAAFSARCRAHADPWEGVWSGVAWLLPGAVRQHDEDHQRGDAYDDGGHGDGEVQPAQERLAGEVDQFAAEHASGPLADRESTAQRSRDEMQHRGGHAIVRQNRERRSS